MAVTFSRVESASKWYCIHFPGHLSNHFPKAGSPTHSHSKSSHPTTEALVWHAPGHPQTKPITTSAVSARWQRYKAPWDTSVQHPPQFHVTSQGNPAESSYLLQLQLSCNGTPCTEHPQTPPASAKFSFSQVSIQKEDRTIVNTYAFNIGAHKLYKANIKDKGRNRQ